MVLLEFLEKSLRNDHFSWKENCYFQFLFLKIWKCLGEVIAICHLDDGNDNNLFLLCFDSGSESLLYHLSELKGMASWKQKYEPLGLDAAGIEGSNLVFW